MTRCDHCSCRLDEADAITNRRGTFCTTDCDERNKRDSWQMADPPEGPGVPVFSDEPWLIEPPEVQPDLPAFCHP